MAKITIKGDTSGEVDIVAPAVAGTTTYNLSTAGGDILASGDIGTTVQGYDADTAKYDDTTANFTGTLQQGGNNVLDTTSTLSSSNLSGALPAIDGSALTNLTSANLTGALPAVDGSALTGISSYADSDALSLFNASGSAPVYACRAWVSFNGGTSPSAGTIQGSGNVSSVTDNATGRATINFTSTMPNADYAVAGICTGYSNYNSSLMVLGSANGSGNQQPTVKTTSAVRVHYGHSNTVVNTDIGYMTVAIFG